MIIFAADFAAINSTVPRFSHKISIRRAHYFALASAVVCIKTVKRRCVYTLRIDDGRRWDIATYVYIARKRAIS